LYVVDIDEFDHKEVVLVFIHYHACPTTITHQVWKRFILPIIEAAALKQRTAQEIMNWVKDQDDLALGLCDAIVRTNEVIRSEPLRDGAPYFDSVPEHQIKPNNLEPTLFGEAGILACDIDHAIQLTLALRDDEGPSVHLLVWEDDRSRDRVRSIAFEACKMCICKSDFDAGVYRVTLAEQSCVWEPPHLVWVDALLRLLR